MHCAQETEARDLFAKKSRWRELKGRLGGSVTNFSQNITLWRVAIQTVEAKHGGPARLCPFSRLPSIGL